MSTKTNAKVIALHLADGLYGEDEIAMIIRGINAARARVRARAKAVLSVGQAVEFTNSRNGLTIQGVITKLGPKNVFVRQTNGVGNWRVAPQLLRSM